MVESLLNPPRQSPKSIRGQAIGDGWLNVHHSHPDAVAEAAKRMRNATTAAEYRLQDAVFVPEASSSRLAALRTTHVRVFATMTGDTPGIVSDNYAHSADPVSKTMTKNC